MRPTWIKPWLLSFFLLGLVGCQQQRNEQKSAGVTVNQQIEQVASLIAGTQYLKRHCNRSDLPEDAVIKKVAYKAAQQRGWDTSAYGTLGAYSDTIYQRLTDDSTPEQTKCATFNKQLAPFTAELRHHG